MPCYSPKFVQGTSHLKLFEHFSFLDKVLTKQVNDPASAFLVASLFRQMVDPVKRPLSKNTIFINYVNKNDTCIKEMGKFKLLSDSLPLKSSLNSSVSSLSELSTVSLVCEYMQ